MEDVEDMEVEKVNETAESDDLFEDPDEEEELTFRGAQFEELARNAFICQDFQSTRCFVQHKNWNLPHPRANKDIWSHSIVRMPWSRHNEFPKNGKIVKRWDLVVMALSRPILQYKDLVSAILSFNKSDRWDFSGLKEYLEEVIEVEEASYFFDVLLKQICDMAMSLPNLVTKPIPLLQKGQQMSITLSQVQIASLLANAFFCTFPKRNALGRKNEYVNFPTINFNRLFALTNDEYQMEKLKCIFNYFRRRARSQSCGHSLVTFHRRVIQYEDLPQWGWSEKKLTKLRVDCKGKIEDAQNRGMLEVDFANSYVGGGVLGHGCVQEEIRFLICPELIVSRLFTERLQDNEVLVIEGFERYSNYTGYASSFQFDGDFEDVLSQRGDRFNSTLVAMDALQFRSPSSQYRKDNIVRELNKAYIGFFNEFEGSTPACVATGNWGCGAFGGDPQLKSLIQLLAAAENGRDVLYFTFGDATLRDELYEIYALLKEKDLSIGDIFNLITSYWSKVLQNEENKDGCLKRNPLFEFIKKSLMFQESTDEDEIVGENATETEKTPQNNQSSPKPVDHPVEMPEAVNTPKVSITKGREDQQKITDFFPKKPATSN